MSEHSTSLPEIMQGRGLTSPEVQERANAGKTNRVEKETSRTWQGIILSNLFNVFNLAIFSIASVMVILYFRLGDIRTLYDAASISTVALVNSVIAMVQEIRAKRALDRILALSRSMSTVLREGKLQEIPMDDIVEGDIVFLSRGDQVPVDGTVLYSNHCEVDESLLTGESEYIFKQEEAEVLSGSFCVAGQGYVQSEKVGKDAYIHRIASEVRSYKRFVSPLQRKIDVLVQVWIGVAVLMLCLVVGEALVSHYLNGQVVDVITKTRSVASIVTSMIPIGLILLSTVAFALGVLRISQKGALIQKLNAVESFANVDVLCMDKTGTLTKNELKLDRLYALGDVSEEDMKLWTAALAHYASDPNATSEALAQGCEKPEAKVLSEVPFNSREKYSGMTVEVGGKTVHLVLGAYEKLGKRCSPEEQERADAQMAELLGYRNLAFAHATDVKGTLQETLEAGEPLKLVGIVSLVDEVRPDISDVLDGFHERGIRLKIISGDAPQTVQSVARASGWKESTERVFTGPELDEMDEHELASVAKNHSLFARVSPQNKQDLIRSLQVQEHYVAMVGDGVNDVLALKQAQMGVAMGAGNRMSKDVSDIVLLNNDFTIMPQVFAEGETIIGNVQSAAKLFLTKNMYAAFLILFTGFLGLSFPFVPRHVTMMGFFSISVPALLITFTKRMNDVPKSFLKDVLGFTFISGALIALASLTVYFLSLVVFKQPTKVAQTALLTQIIPLGILNFVLIVGRDRLRELLRKNWEMSLLAGSSLVLYFLLLFTVTSVKTLFGFKIQAFLELFRPGSGEFLAIFFVTLVAGSLMIFLQQWLIKAEQREPEQFP